MAGQGPVSSLKNSCDLLSAWEGFWNNAAFPEL